MNMLYVFYGSLGFNALALILYAFYPDSLKLAYARMMGENYAIILGKDRKLRIKTASKELEFFKTNDGLYELEPEDAFSYNGCPAALWYESYNKAANPKIIPYISRLKKLSIETRSQLDALLATPKEQLLEMENGEDLVTLAREIEEDSYILNVAEVIRLRDLYGYLKARNPAAQKGYVEREVAKERYKHNNPLQNYFPYVIMAAILIFALAIGYQMMGTGAAGAAASAASGAGAGSSMTLT